MRGLAVRPQDPNPFDSPFRPDQRHFLFEGELAGLTQVCVLRHIRARAEKLFKIVLRQMNTMGRSSNWNSALCLRRLAAENICVLECFNGRSSNHCLLVGSNQQDPDIRLPI